MNDIALQRSLTADLIALEGLYGAKNYKPLDVVLTRGQGVHVWDVETAREVMPPWTNHANDGIDLAFNHAGDRLLSIDMDRQTRLWDAAEKPTLSGPKLSLQVVSTCVSG